MSRVMTFGTFDIFHKGHESYLNQARKYGNYLICVIARDKTVQKVKGKLPLNNEKKRLRIVKECKLADKVILGNLRDKYAVIRKYQPDVICLGYDQKAFTEKLKDMGIKVVRLNAYKPEIYKTSKINQPSF